MERSYAATCCTLVTLKDYFVQLFNYVAGLLKICNTAYSKKLHMRIKPSEDQKSRDSKKITVEQLNKPGKQIGLPKFLPQREAKGKVHDYSKNPSAASATRDKQRNTINLFLC